MKKFLMPTILLFAGAASLFSPLLADQCGTYPVVHVPSKCEPPHEVEANPPGGMCTKESDGSCASLNCHEMVWSNAIPGRCGNGIITENNVPRCMANFAVTNVTIHEYAMTCTDNGSSCACELVATGESDPAPVCNCQDLEPLH